MDKKKKIIIVIVVVLAIILLSVGGYFIYKNVTKKDGDDSKEDGNLDTGTDTGTSVDNSSGSSGVSNIPANPFSNSAELKKFQQYVINVRGDKAVLGSGGDSGYGDDGKWGRKSALAYDKYGKDYQAYLKAPLIPPKPNTTTTSANSSLIKEGDKVYTRSTGKLPLYEYPSTDSEIGYLKTGTYDGGCNKSGSVYICMDKPIGTVLGIFPDNWTKIRVDVKHYDNKHWYSAKWTTTPQDFFVKSFQLVKR